MQFAAQVGLANYQGLGGFGIASPEQMDALHKALTAGSDINNPGASPGQGFALRVESLEATAILTAHSMDDIRFWKQIPKTAAYNTVEEYNVLSSYGEGDDAFVDEGALPGVEDSTYDRETAKIKFLGTQRKVSHPMTLVTPAHGNVVAQEQQNGMLWLLKILEKALFKADSSLDPRQFDGLSTMIANRSPASHTIDMRGAPLDEDKLTDAALLLSDVPNHGKPTHLHCNVKAHSDLIRQFFPKQRLDLFRSKEGDIGLDINGFRAPTGRVSFEPNIFIEEGGAPYAAATTGEAAALVPGNPTISTGATSPVAAGSQFLAADAGEYSYWITAHNNKGHSAAVSIGAAVAVAAGDKVTFGVTPAAGNATLWYELFRTKKGVTGITNARKIKRIANAAGAGETVLNDLNEDLPFTTEAYLIQQTPDVIQWKQLAPFVKIPLAIVDAHIRWMQLLYGTPVLKAPRKVLRFKNIGRAAGGVTT